jgi:hypothetical protein
MCVSHYRRWQRYGTPGAVEILPQGGKVPRPSYNTAHRRVRRARGAARTHQCARCTSPAQEWAYDHADPNELHERVKVRRGHTRVLAYSADPARYLPLCLSDHIRFDLRSPR